MKEKENIRLIPIDRIIQDRQYDSYFKIEALGYKVKVYYKELLGEDCVSITNRVIKIKDHPDKLGIDYENMQLRIDVAYAKKLFPLEGF